MTEDNENIVNIWYLVGIILSLYGVIITGCGIYYLKQIINRDLINI